MHRRQLFLAVALAVGVVTLPGVLPASADHGDAVPPSWSEPKRGATTRGGGQPWRTPTRPDTCTIEEMESGDVAGCLVDGPGGSPAERGFGVAPFPQRAEGALLPWKRLGVGAEGPLVTKVQIALRTNGYSISADGDFGPMTRDAVAAFQRAEGLSDTGVVDRRTAARLGVERRVLGSFPPSGWNWLGWGYNGSPALREWESMMVPSRAVDGFAAGRLTAHPEVVGLYEGFMADMTALGYRPYEIGSYVFRCTSGSGKTCDGMSRSSLSNHAFGLAIDMNTALNPEIDYAAQGSTSACAVPMRTDLPRAVVRAAEKWGLYWGGYGWYGGCESPEEWRSSVHRDPMHFEFRGDVLIARAIIAHNRGTTVPRRWCGEVVQTVGRRATGVSSICSVTDRPPAGSILALRIAADDATAASVSITASGERDGSITAVRCSGKLRPRPLMAVSAERSSVATVLPLEDGRVCVDVPSGVTMSVTRTATWSTDGSLGIVSLDPPLDASPGNDGVVEIEGRAAAVWVSVDAVQDERTTAAACSAGGSAARAVSWMATADLEELQVVRTTQVGDVSRWCLDGTAQDVVHRALIVDGEGVGLVADGRPLDTPAPLEPGTTGVVVQVAAGDTAVVVAACRDSEVVRQLRVEPSSQVSTVFLATADATQICVTGDRRAHLLGRAHPAGDLMTTGRPTRKVTLRT